MTADDKQTIPRFNGPPENVKFRATRIKALLAEKEIDNVLDWNEDEIPKTSTAVKQVKKF